MKAVTGVIFAFVWMILVFMVGLMVIGNLAANANNSGALNASAGTAWTSFMQFVWIAVGILAFTPLIMVVLIFAGLFGQVGGGPR